MGLGGKVEAVLTCQGNITDPDFPDRCQNLFDKLSKLLDNSKYSSICFKLLFFSNYCPMTTDQLLIKIVLELQVIHICYFR